MNNYLGAGITIFINYSKEMLITVQRIFNVEGGAPPSAGIEGDLAFQIPLANELHAVGAQPAVVALGGK